jgi:hypothetical protein
VNHFAVVFDQTGELLRTARGDVMYCNWLTLEEAQEAARLIRLEHAVDARAVKGECTKEVK